MIRFESRHLEPGTAARFHLDDCLSHLSWQMASEVDPDPGTRAVSRLEDELRDLILDALDGFEREGFREEAAEEAADAEFCARTGR